MEDNLKVVGVKYIVVFFFIFKFMILWRIKNWHQNAYCTQLRPINHQRRHKMNGISQITAECTHNKVEQLII